MKARVFRLKLTLAGIVCLVAALLVCVDKAATQGTSALSPQEKRGKQIYQKGEGGFGGGEIVAFLNNDELELPATSFTCVNCHGLRGEGTREGGIQPPPITWEKLTGAQTSPLTRRERAPYNEATLARSINAGLDANGARLHPAMPRYRMTAAQMADLIAYLKKLGKEADADPGLTDDTIKVGAALPMTGPLASVGEDVKATLAASFAQLNSQGGIYNRRFELVVEDSRGEPAQTLEATRRLIERDGVFALIGSFEPGDSRALNEFIKRSEVPLVGPVTLSPRLSVPPNPYVFYLLPTFSDQARALVDFVYGKARGKPARLAVVYADNDFDRDALAGLQAQAKMYSMEIVAEHSYKSGQFSAAKTVEALMQKKPDFIFFFGGADDIAASAREMERVKLNAALLSSVVMLGRGAFNLPASQAAQTFLSYPATLPNQNDFAEFIAVMQKAGAPLRSPAFQSVAYAATKVLFEATKLGGRQLDRTTLINSLEQIQDFRTGVVPPVTFGPNRRVGSIGSYIVGVDLGNKQYTPLTDRLVPKERP
ncbi:MAG TPA: ABC transporter substrate-binding protein [Pyrinomonadaceae bacterium]|jgi:ABC-type branched-subunit amino acid transport system substrate-binding protein